MDLKTLYSWIQTEGLVAPSTVSGWRKAKKHPAWVDALGMAWDRVESLREDNKALRRTIQVLSNPQDLD